MLAKPHANCQSMATEEDGMKRFDKARKKEQGLRQ